MKSEFTYLNRESNMQPIADTFSAYINSLPWQTGLNILLLGDLLTSREFYDLVSIRVLVFLVILGIIGWSYHRSFIRYMQPAISLVPLIAGLGVAIMILIIQSEERYNQYYVGFIIIFIYIHVLLRLRFVYATAVCWFIFFLFVYASLQIDLPVVSFINSTFFSGVCQICGMVAS